MLTIRSEQLDRPRLRTCAVGRARSGPPLQNVSLRPWETCLTVIPKHVQDDRPSVGHTRGGGMPATRALTARVAAEFIPAAAQMRPRRGPAQGAPRRRRGRGQTLRRPRSRAPRRRSARQTCSRAARAAAPSGPSRGGRRTPRPARQSRGVAITSERMRNACCCRPKIVTSRLLPRPASRPGLSSRS